MQRQRLYLILITLALIITAVLVAPHTLAMNNGRLGDYLRSSHPSIQADQVNDSLGISMNWQPNTVFKGALAMLTDQN